MQSVIAGRANRLANGQTGLTDTAGYWARDLWHWCFNIQVLSSQFVSWFSTSSYWMDKRTKIELMNANMVKVIVSIKRHDICCIKCIWIFLTQLHSAITDQRVTEIRKLDRKSLTLQIIEKKVKVSLRLFDMNDLLFVINNDSFIQHSPHSKNYRLD